MLTPFQLLKTKLKSERPLEGDLFGKKTLLLSFFKFPFGSLNQLVNKKIIYIALFIQGKVTQGALQI